MRPLTVAIVWLVVGAAIALGCGGEEEAEPPAPVAAFTSTPAGSSAGTGASPVPASPTPAVDGEALLRRAFENLNALPGIGLHQTITSSGQGITVQAEQDMLFEAPDKVYVVTSALGATSEVYVEGESFYVREAGADWALSSPPALGLNPDNLLSTLDTTALASSIDVLGEFDEDGRRLIEIAVELDTDAYYEEVLDLFLDESLLSQGDVRFESVEVRYVVDAETVLLVGGRANVEVTAGGIAVYATTEFEYEPLTAPVEFPAGLPTPGNTGQGTGDATALDGGTGCGTAEERTARLVGMLSRLPASREALSYVYYDDYECARTFLGVALPDEDASGDELLAYRDALVEGAHVAEDLAHFAGFSSLFEPEAWNVEVGFNVDDVDQFVQAGRPRERKVVLRGRFDPDDIEAAVTSGPAASLGLETIEFSPDISYYSWGRDYQQDLRNRTPFRPIGQAARLVPGEEFLLFAHASADIESMIAASVGGLPSLADVPELEAIANVLGDIGAYSVVISAESNSLGDTGLNDIVTGEYGAQKVEALRAGGILHPYYVLAVGIGQESGDLYSILAYAHADPGTAQANAIRLDSILADGMSLFHGDAWSNHVERYEVHASGAVTYARLWSSDPILGYSAFFNLDSLILSE